ncbi:glycosyltransferase family 1 protein, partial [Aquisalimonas sp.]|uniref:glycosyltransferase family 4 protein n=1 Tax=Aquisalimonas sp. TaxID=1872621 RepID=UPI0025C1F8FF
RGITTSMNLPRGADLFHSPDYELPRLPLPGVVTVHDLSHRFFPEHHPASRVRHLERILPASLERAAAIITVSHTVRHELVTELGVEPGRVHAIANGARAAFRADCKPDVAAHAYDLTPGKYILSVGALEPRKNLARLLDAYLQLPSTLRNAYPLILAGPDGWADRRLRASVKRACATGAVRRLGYVPDEILPSLYAGAAAFVYPSVYEGFGLPVLEAMACGTPVITNGTGALSEVAGEAAVTVDVYDTIAIRDALERILTDHGLSARLRQAGPRRASGFTWSATAEATCQVYAQVLGNNGQ